ncbi:phosphoribosylformylglycinamidine cyclo-ligase [archaeon BMS3Abin16]|nr:phosphoribosylformylglycinamidine cyclo-ligase [archaeon BMS3Abin16]
MFKSGITINLLDFLQRFGENLAKDYAQSGVDIDVEGAAVSAIVSQIKGSLKSDSGSTGENLTGIGHFCSLVRIDSTRALAIATDGVGSKIKIAEELGSFETIGIDLIAMNVNDMICTGARPLSLVDYIAFEKVDPEVAGAIGVGLAAGAEQAGISISGGEIATLPEIIRGVDLAGTGVGIVDIESVVTGEKIEVGDVVICLESSGVHSNGLTLARKVLLKHYSIDDKIFGEKTVGQELLTPTKIYVPEVMELVEKVDIHGLANITGGGLGNLQRITKYGFEITNLPEPQAVFKKIQQLENIVDSEMYRTFNMGVGFCVVVKAGDADAVIEICKTQGTTAQVIGTVIEEPGVRVKDFVLSY